MTDLFNGTLKDSDTNETLTADDLGLTDEQYGSLVEESTIVDDPVTAPMTRVEMAQYLRDEYGRSAGCYARTPGRVNRYTPKGRTK